MGLGRGGGISTITNLINALLVDPVYYVDPATGSDANAGTITAPLLTVNEANKRLSFGYYGFATINLRAGTHTIGANTIWPSGSASTAANAGGLLVNGVDNTDSGLGARTSAGGTTGTALTPIFGTCIDSVGGLVVNAHRGKFLRFTSGATLNGRSFLIAANSATTFTLCGTLPVAPTVETFVVETPAAQISWAGTQNMRCIGPQVGFQNVAFTGPGGGNALRIVGFTLGTQRCSFATLGSGGIQLREGAGITDTNAIQPYISATAITQQCGSYYNTTPISAAFSSTSGLVPCRGINLNRSLFNGSNVEALTSVTSQFISSYFVGNSYVRSGYKGMTLIAQCVFDTVTPAPALAAVISSASGAAIVYSKNASGLVSNSSIDNTPATTAPGNAILVEDGSLIGITNVSGAGNAGLGCQVNELSRIKVGANVTVTGTAGDASIGAAAPVAWAALAAINTDPVELCIGGP